jgi:hypothetical protein
LRVTMKR